MASDATSIKDLIEEVEQPFRAGGEEGVYDRMRAIQDIVFTRFDYTKKLSPNLQQKISVPADLLRFYKEQTKASLRDDLGLHLEPVGNLIREETAADKVEVMEAHSLMRLDPDGYIRDTMHDFQTRSLYFAAWLEEQEWKTPEQAKGESDKDYVARVERERSSWFPYRLLVKNPETVAFRERDREITLGTLRFKLPVIDLMDRYGDYKVSRNDPAQALKVFNEHYGFLRGDEDRSEWGAREVFGKEVDCCAVDDGLTICHYADLDGVRGRDKRYEGLGEVDYDNPFGQVSLLIAEGVYNAFEPLAYRREPLMLSLIKIEHGRAMLKSHWASRAASPTPIYEQLPSELVKNLAELPAPMTAALLVDPQGRPLIQRALGDVKGLENEVEAPYDKLFGIWEQEIQVASPRGLLSSPNLDPEVAVSLALIDLDEHNRLLAEAKKSEMTFFGRVLDMLKCSRINHLNKHRTKGEPARESDWPMSFTTTGKEWKVKGKVIKRGEKYEVTPQDLDGEYIRTIEPIDNRQSTQNARIDLAAKRRAMGTLLWDEYVEMNGVENVTEFNEKMAEEMLFQLGVPQAIMETRVQVAQITALINDTTVEEVLIGMPEEVVPQITNAVAPGGTGTMRMATPQTEGIGTMGNSGSMT
jgi:hypothetical protein